MTVLPGATEDEALPFEPPVGAPTTAAAPAPEATSSAPLPVQLPPPREHIVRTAATLGGATGQPDGGSVLEITFVLLALAAAIAGAVHFLFP